MTTLYLKIEERDDILASNFRAYWDGNGGAAEANAADEIISGIMFAVESLVKDGLASSSCLLEAKKLKEEHDNLCFSPRDIRRARINLAKKALKEAGVSWKDVDWEDEGGES